MNFIQPQPRGQISFGSLEDAIEPDNPVRLIDAFVDQLDLKRLGFNVAELNKEGRPSYHSSFLLKLYLYGYLNAIRSSRRLARECIRNLELQCLMGLLKPKNGSRIMTNSLGNT